MSQRSVERLYNAIYVSPALMPGYGGYVPSVKFSCGETFGNATAKHYDDYRCAATSTSTSPHSLGSMFPTIYSSDPRLAPGNACRGADRCSYSPYWASENVGYDRQTELKRFDQLAHKHREHYLDTTGTRQPVPYFATARGREEEREKI